MRFDRLRNYYILKFDLPRRKKNVKWPEVLLISRLVLDLSFARYTTSKTLVIALKKEKEKLLKKLQYS